MPKRLPVEEVLKRRFEKWVDQDPSSLLTKRVEKATAPLVQLVALFLPNQLIGEVVNKTLWVAQALTDRDDVYKSLSVDSIDKIKACKLDRCDAVADGTHNWAIGAAAAFGAWDLVGPLGIAPSLVSLFTLSFRTIKKIGLCYGYSTHTRREELIVLEIFAAATGLYHRDKIQALKAIEQLCDPRFQAQEISEATVVSTVERLSQMVSTNLTRRRALAALPAMGALVGGSTNAWVLSDVGWAARNIYAKRRLDEARKAEQDATSQKEPLLLKAA